MERLLKILNEIKEDIDYTSEKGIITNGIFDSIDLVALLGEIEDEFDVEITYDMLTAENFDSVSKIWSLIERLSSEDGE